MDYYHLRSCASGEIYFNVALNWAPMATTGPVSARRPHNLSPPARRVRIYARGPPTVPPPLGACRCISVYPASLPPSTLSHPIPTATSHPFAYSPVSLSPAAKTLHGPPLSASPWPLTRPASTTEQYHCLYHLSVKLRRSDRFLPLTPQDDP